MGLRNRVLKERKVGECDTGSHMVPIGYGLWDTELGDGGFWLGGPVKTLPLPVLRTNRTW